MDQFAAACQLNVADGETPQATRSRVEILLALLAADGKS